MSDYNVPEAGSHVPWKQSLRYLRVTLGPRASRQGNGNNSFHQKKSAVIACVPRAESHNQVEETALNHNRIKLDKQTPFVPLWLWVFCTDWVALRSYGFSSARSNHRVLTVSVISSHGSRWTTLGRKDGLILAAALSCPGRVLISKFQSQLTEVWIIPERHGCLDLNSLEDTNEQIHADTHAHSESCWLLSSVTWSQCDMNPSSASDP